MRALPSPSPGPLPSLVLSRFRVRIYLGSFCPFFLPSSGEGEVVPVWIEVEEPQEETLLSRLDISRLQFHDHDTIYETFVQCAVHSSALLINGFYVNCRNKEKEQQPILLGEYRGNLKEYRFTRFTRIINTRIRADITM